MQNIMVIVVEFGWMSEIIIFEVNYVKYIDFDVKTWERQR